MQYATERRQLILEYISDQRIVKLQDIADKFGICKRTAVRDVQLLACSHPIYTLQGGAGGVRAMEGWYCGHRYLQEDQESLLRNLLEGLQPKDRKIMEQILQVFSKPHPDFKEV